MCSVGDALVEILNGLRTYFDKSLPAMLLYKPERGQYLEHVPENSTIAPSSVYGAEHLLRLFGKTYCFISYDFVFSRLIIFCSKEW